MRSRKVRKDGLPYIGTTMAEFRSRVLSMTVLREGFEWGPRLVPDP